VESILDYIEACLEELVRDYPSAAIILAGDFNQISESTIIERTGFDSREFRNIYKLPV